MQLTVNIPNEKLFDKILWLLNSFKNDGVEVIVHQEKRANPQESLKGIFPHCADVTKQEQEKDAWKNSVVKKYQKQ